MLAKYAEIEVPRYTSYPTAAQFRDDIGEESYRKWLADLDPDEAFSIYVHVPFCQSLCWYCACHTTIVHDYNRVGQYLDVLKQELRLLSHAVPGKHKTKQLHFGGGTPTILSGEDFAEFVGEIRACFAFDKEAEIAVEIDPRTLLEDKAKSLAAAGVTRASLGVQELSQNVQRKINREQPFEVVKGCVERLRNAGITAINFDLMYGLPGQSVEDVKKTIDLCVTLEPDRVAMFGYAHVPWFKKHQSHIDKADLPGTQERLRQAAAARDTLVSFGYCPVGFDHFAKPEDPLAVAARNGQLKRNFQGYTTDDCRVLLALGASSIGSLPHAYVQNAPRLHHYRDLVQAGRLPVTRGVSLSLEDHLRRIAIERLMCNFELDAAALCRESNLPEDTLDVSISALTTMDKDGLVECDGRLIRVTDRGRLLVRNVAACFDSYWKPAPSRHSQAV